MTSAAWPIGSSAFTIPLPLGTGATPYPQRMRALADRALGILRRYPLTIGYSALLLATSTWLETAPPARVAAFEQAISTNLDNLGEHPVAVLLASLLAAAPGHRFLFLGLVVLAVGLCENWLGTWRTLVLYVAGNAIATLVVAGWIEYAIAAGRYDAGVRGATDYGVSYGLNTLLFALVARPRRRVLNALLAAGAAGWLLLEEPWDFLATEDFSGLGHAVSSAVGLGVAAGILVHRGTHRSPADGVPAVPAGTGAAVRAD